MTEIIYEFYSALQRIKLLKRELNAMKGMRTSFEKTAAEIELEAGQDNIIARDLYFALKKYVEEVYKND